MMFPYKNILYYPDPEVSGGGEEGGGEGNGNGGRDYSDPGSHTESMGNGGTENGGRGKDKEREEEIYKRSFEGKIPKRGDRKCEKEINKFTTSRKLQTITSKGETRRIAVEGTPGSIFTLTAVDGSDCSILSKKQENVVMPTAGRYTFSQNFPSIITDGGAAKTKETYTFTIKVGADVCLKTNETFSISQIADPIITITNTTSQTGPALSVSGSDLVLTGQPNKPSQTSSLSTYTLTITGSNTGTAESLYVKNADFNSNLSVNTVIKKVIDRCGETGSTSELVLKPLTTRTESTIEGEDTKTGDLKKGMTMTGSVTYTKTLVGNLDEDDNIVDYNTCKTKILTDKFKLSDTNDLRKGMRVLGAAEGTHIVSVDCDKKVTLDKKQIIKRDATLTFTHNWHNRILKVVSNSNSKGKAQVLMNRKMDIIDNTTLEFNDNTSLIRGITNFSGSGSDSITFTTYVGVINFGDKNVTHTLDLDELITSKPNAYDRAASTRKDTAVTINMIRGDFDANASSKTGTVVRSPQNGTVGAYRTSTDDFIYTPANGFTGEDLFTYTMSDSVNTSDEKTVRITVK